jgi:DNA-directed RNA polymerase subunit RPC12/RpoP
MSQNFNLNISLDKTTPIVCEECSNKSFIQVTFLRKVSKFITGTDQDALIPVPSFSCSKCGHVNVEFLPKDLQ